MTASGATNLFQQRFQTEMEADRSIVVDRSAIQRWIAERSTTLD